MTTSIDNLVFRFAGVFVLASLLLAHYHSPYWLWFTAFVGANLLQASQANQLMLERRLDPCMSEVFPFSDIPLAHEKMLDNKHLPGNMAVLVTSPKPGLRTVEDVLEAGPTA